MADPIREALKRLLAVIKPKYTDPDEIVAVVRAMAAARTALAAEPPAPAPADHIPGVGNMVAPDDEREELAQWLDHKGRGAWPCPDGFSAEAEAEEYEMFSGLTRAAALLREARPQPVPVAERPWERPGWCDAEGRCWMGDPGDEGFIQSWWYCRHGAPSMTVSLPHWAIPQPPQGGEVEP